MERANALALPYKSMEVWFRPLRCLSCYEQERVEASGVLCQPSTSTTVVLTRSPKAHGVMGSMTLSEGRSPGMHPRSSFIPNLQLIHDQLNLKIDQ